MAPPATHLAWVDLETTGTDERRDSIIEVGFILTDMEMNTHHQESWVVQPDVPLQVLVPEMPKVVRDMHEANGLLNDLRAFQGTELREVEKAIIDIFETNMIERHAVMLAGSGVGHFDKRFIQAQMPALFKCLAYPVIDVGVMRRFIRDICGLERWVPTEGESALKTHRAQDDIRQHLSEAKQYRDILVGVDHGLSSTKEMDFWG